MSAKYFMFSVEGTETVKNGWSKRMRAIDAVDVPLKIVYRVRDYQYGPKPVRFVTWTNDQEHKLGDSPLPNGIVRLYQQNGKGGLGFLAQQQVNYSPIQSKVEINTGVNELVVYQPTRGK